MAIRKWRHYRLAVGVVVALALLSVTDWSESFVKVQLPCTVTVKPGESIQKAIDEVKEGVVVCLEASTQNEGLMI